MCEGIPPFYDMSSWRCVLLSTETNLNIQIRIVCLMFETDLSSKCFSLLPEIVIQHRS
jgi:hypothetical protein